MLTNLAQLIYSSGGSVDNALLLVRSALRAADNDKDPDANFLLGNLLMAKAKYREAFESYQRTVKMLPTFPSIVDYLRHAKCLADRHSSNDDVCHTEGGCGKDPGSLLTKYISCSGSGSCGINFSEGDEVIARIEIGKQYMRTGQQVISSNPYKFCLNSQNFP